MMRILDTKSIFTALFAFMFVAVQAQTPETCEELVDVVQKQLTTEYISDGQVYMALIEEEDIAEFQTTFFGGSTYRISASAGTEDTYVIFKVYDASDEKRLLFSNADFENAPYWDFEVENTMNVRVEAMIDPDKKISACSIMMIGFKPTNPITTE